MSEKRIYIIDGYNVIHRDATFRKHLERDLFTARSALINFCADWMSLRKDVWLFFIVFDGDSSVQGMNLPARKDVRVVYTQSGETADDRILDIVRERSYDSSLTVVSDDRTVAREAKQSGADVSTVEEFCMTLRARKKKQAVVTHNAGKSGGKVSPREEADINRELMNEWGLDEQQS